MKILVIGGGGREHAIVWHLKNISLDNKQNEVFVYPGNKGMKDDAIVVENVSNLQELIQYIKKNEIRWTIVGPENLLADGIADLFEAEGLNIFGPLKNAAHLESSKDFAKQFMVRHGIPTSSSETFSDLSMALDYVESKKDRIVIKADGLAAGKGVVIPKSNFEAAECLKEMFGGRFGDAGKRVLIEDFVEGTELSYMIFTDGKSFKAMKSVKDFKRLLDNDMGPNTGGMGVYSPSPLLTSELNARIEYEIVYPVLEGFKKEGIDYKGVLYIGLFITREGPKVCEFNVRFGDPETQAVLLRLKTPLIEICEGVKRKELDRVHIEWSDDFSGGVVIASPGYPDKYEKNIKIKGVDKISSDVIVFHAGTAILNGDVVNSGGRVLNVMAKGPGYGDIFKKIYCAIDKIDFPGMQYRKDICPLNQ